MAVPMWRMNRVWKRMAGVLLLCTLLLCNEVMCQDDAATNGTDGPAAADPGATIDPAADSTGTFLNSTDLLVNLSIAADPNGSALGMPAAPSDEEEMSAATVAPEFFVVSCIKPQDVEDLAGTNQLWALVETANCEETKRIFQEGPPILCKKKSCELKLHQNGDMVVVSSQDVDSRTLGNLFHSEHLKGKLQILSSPPTPTPASSSSSSGSSVFVGVLVSGLLAAAAITVGYCKCQRRSDTKGVKLAEEAYPVDQENQGNTLVSVAPLNPPPETLEKPSVNGESPEAVKTEPAPPTNGHSTSNTADTEM